MTPRPAAAVFDLDGTLIDSLPGLHMAASEAMASLGLPAPERGAVRRFIGDGVPMLMARCLAHVGGDADLGPEAVRLFRARYDADPMRGTEPLPGAAELLARLAGAGIPLGLCTNKPEAPARAILEATGLAAHLPVIAGGDTLAARKPDPAPLLHVLGRLGAEPDASLYVGDSGTDWQTARAAGVPYAHLAEGYGPRPIEGLAPAIRLARLADLAEALRL